MGRTLDEVTLPGPSRTIIVEPLEVPEQRPVRAPEPPPPAPPPREPGPAREPVPARA